MSKRSEQQHDEILEKLNQLLEQNKILAQQNAQKDDEIALLKEQNNYLMQKLFGNFLANQSKLENKAMKKLLLKNIVVAKKEKG